jgi:hypothetical protein
MARMVIGEAMTSSKPTYYAEAEANLADHDGEQRKIALEYIAQAWNQAEDDGIDSMALAHASLFAALATLVTAYGDDGAAELINCLPERIRAGEYNIARSLQ